MIAALIVLAVVCFMIAAIYNGLIGLRNQVENAFKQIDVQLKRRHDLIPNLVASVKGEMKFEQETLEKVIKARSEAMSVKAGDIGDLAAKEGALSAALGKLIALSENYPNLKSNESVNKLMEELTHTENQISFSRQFYNDVSTKYNTKQQVFPNNIFASMFGFTTSQLWELPANSTERENVKVDLTL